MKIFYYKASTNNIEVKVSTEFVEDDFSKNQNLFLWRYFVKIKNNSPQTVQIIKRYWKILNEDGSIQEISGDGVIGKQPILTPQLEFEYDSKVQLKYHSAIMGGFYEAKKENQEIFKVIIPNFSLDIPNLFLTVN